VVPSERVFMPSAVAVIQPLWKGSMKQILATARLAGVEKNRPQEASWSGGFGFLVTKM
jgi:hypothetical protein